jgi:hypothetical protein
LIRLDDGERLAGVERLDALADESDDGAIEVAPAAE